MMDKNNELKIAFYLVTDIQHIPPVVRLLPYLGGIIVTRNPEIYNHIKSKYPEVQNPLFLVKTHHHAQMMMVRKRIRMVIYPGFTTIYRGKSVQIFHGGLSDKNYVESLKILLYHLVLFPGEKTRDKVEKSGYLKFIKNWELVGYPKFDPLVNQNLQVDPIFRNGRKTILYAPTWISRIKGSDMIRFSKYGESSINIWAKEIIKSLYKDYNLIIKYHSRLVREKGDIYEQIDDLIKTLGAESTVVTRIDDNILPYMYQSDLMISDISTACYEWFHFNRPIVYANPAPGKYFVSDDISSNTYAWQAGDVINNADDIHGYVSENIRTDKYQEIRNKLFNYTVYKPDGKATERQAQAILNFYRKFEKTPYMWLMLSSWGWGRGRRFITKFVHRYYRWFKKEKVGK